MPLDLNGNIISTTSITQSTFSGTVITDGLICHLDAGNKNSYSGSGTIWTDLSDSGNNFTLNNTSFNSGNGGYIVLNGTNAYASISNLSLNGGFTLEIWAYNNTGSFSIFGQGTTALNDGLHILYDTGPRGMIYAMYSNDNDYQENYRPSTGTWYNWVFTYNGSSYEKRFYANGDLIRPGASVQNIYTGTGQFTIGLVFNGAFLPPANGRVGAVRIYNRVLNSAEILSNYYAQKSRFGI